MKIAIDARILERKMTGVGRYLTGLLNELHNYDSKNSYILFSQNKLNNIHPFYKNITTGKIKFIPDKIYSPIWTNFVLPGFLKQHKVDIFFSANQLVPVFKVRGVKYISAIYDVFHRVNKSFHSKIFRTYIDFFLKLTIKKSDHIVTISQNSKKDIQFFFKVPSSKVSVIYPAADERFMPGELGEVEKLNLKSQYSLPEVFVLYVGVIEIRKNIFTIIKIADRMIEIMPDVKFLFIGRPGFGSKKILKEVIKRKNIVYLNHIDDASLINIYKLSSAFIFPSFYEGYGLPPMEAMKSGVPVLAANTSSLNEILDGGAILIDPSDDKAFTCELIKLLKDEVYNNNWKNKGIKTAEKFSYKKSAAELINVFNSFQN